MLDKITLESLNNALDDDVLNFFIGLGEGLLATTPTATQQQLVDSILVFTIRILVGMMEQKQLGKLSDGLKCQVFVATDKEVTDEEILATFEKVDTRLRYSMAVAAKVLIQRRMTSVANQASLN